MPLEPRFLCQLNGAIRSRAPGGLGSFGLFLLALLGGLTPRPRPILSLLHFSSFSYHLLGCLSFVTAAGCYLDHSVLPTPGKQRLVSFMSAAVATSMATVTVFGVYQRKTNNWKKNEGLRTQPLPSNPSR